MKIKLHHGIIVLLLFATFGTPLSSAFAQGTAFTYQGQLQNNGSPANGSYDLSFTLYNASSGGIGLFGPLTNSATGVTNGLFTTTLDFGSGVFNGTSYWLQIGVRTNGGASFATLTPRQQITPTPYAVYSSSADAAGTVSGSFSGDVTGSQGATVVGNVGGYEAAAVASGASAANAATSGAMPGTIVKRDGAGNFSAGTVTASFTGNGAGLTGISVAASNLSGTITGSQIAPAAISTAQLNTLVAPASGQVLAYNGSSLAWSNPPAGGGGGSSSNAWSLTGNAGTSPANGNFMGTTDSNSLELHVNGVRGWQLAPTADTPNVIGGAPGNFVATGVQGATIGGGGTITTYGHPYTNSIFSFHGTIGGGLGNIIGTSSQESTIGGGNQNAITNIAADSTIGGGIENTIEGETPGCTIGGGEQNVISAWDHGTISGGVGNTIGGYGYQAVIGGGNNNQAYGGNSVVGGGYNNTVSGYGSTIGGGEANQVSGQGSYIGGGGITADYGPSGNSIADDGATIAGGWGNSIPSGGTFAFIGGGANNKNSGYAAVIGGGNANIASGTYATVPGGSGNTAHGNYSFAAGENVSANDNNSFIWGDGTRNGVSQGVDTFTVLATGGVFFYTTTSSLNVEVDPTGDLDFGTTTRQMLNLYSSSYGIGVQPSDEYFRSGGQFYWYQGGTYTNANGNAGGGSTLMSLSSFGNLTIAGTLTQNSDRNVKTNIVMIDPQTVLAKLATIPMMKWTYKTEAPGIRHLGPMAQDFHAAFGLNGDDNKHITTVDESGVALAAIQGLNQKLNEKDAEIQALKQQNNSLAERLNELEATVNALAAKK